MKPYVPPTGVLLFISLFERQAIVLVDKAISKKISNETWHEVIQTMLTGIKSGHLAKGIEQGVFLSGQLLTEYFPINPDNAFATCLRIASFLKSSNIPLV